MSAATRKGDVYSPLLKRGMETAGETSTFWHDGRTTLEGVVYLAALAAWSMLSIWPCLGIVLGLVHPGCCSQGCGHVWLFVVPACFFAVYAINLIRLGVMRKPMAQITAHGIEIFNPVRMRYIAWSELSAVEILHGRRRNQVQKPPFQFYGFRLVPKGFDGWITPCIEFTPHAWGVSDQTWWEALSRYRPDLFTPAVQAQVASLAKDPWYPDPEADQTKPAPRHVNSGGSTVIDHRGWTG